MDQATSSKLDLKLKKYQVFEHSLFLGLNVWDLDESCTLKKINHSKSLELWNLYTNGQNNSNVINCIVAICIDR
ncbi:unnamed protein product [Rhizophagus irregularis]|nr:unnamed protein product [Rhizophagus irregularis]